MELVTISQVSRMFGVSTRMLRYYEQIGLLPSLKKDDYAYRVYDECSVSRLQQIIILRKLRIPLKQISMIFEASGTTAMLEVFKQNVSEIEDEITALSTMRLILSNFIDELQIKTDISLKTVLFSDESLLNAINSLSLTKINFKEEKSMDELNKASETLSKLSDVRILHLPPCAVAASHCFGKTNGENGENPESKAGNQLMEFILKSNLYQIKPDARVFGFNHPNPSKDREDYGYEFWVTIPDDMEVPEPFQKKHFPGGLYAAHMIQMDNFHEWEWLTKWVRENHQYEANYSHKGEEIMGGCLEEHLNFVYNVCVSNLKWFDNEVQLDLLTPIKYKK